MGRLKILHVVSIVAPRYAGAGIASQMMARYQAQEGHKVAICTTNVDFPKGTLMVPSSEPVYENGLLIWYFPVQIRSLLVSIPLWLWLKAEIRSFDIIHIHGLYRFPVTSAAYWARQAEIPYVIMPHGSLDPFLYNQSQHNLLFKRIYERLFDIPNLNHATAIHYTAEEEAKRASFLRLRSKFFVVPDGIGWESYLNLPPKGSFRRHLGLDGQTPLVLFLGRINFAKGLDLLIPAFGRVAQQHPDARLAVVGPDNEGYCSKVRRWCEEQCIQDRVFFVDNLGLEKVKEAYVDSNVFVLPSYSENFGLTVVEAMACGTPVIISDQVNIWREVQEAGAGIVVRLDPREVAEAMCRVLGDQGEAKAMGTRGRVTAEKYYAWPRIVKQLTQVYRELLEDKTTSNWSTAK